MGQSYTWHTIITLDYSYLSHISTLNMAEPIIRKPDSSASSSKIFIKEVFQIAEILRCQGIPMKSQFQWFSIRLYKNHVSIIEMTWKFHHSILIGLQMFPENFRLIACTKLAKWWCHDLIAAYFTKSLYLNKFKYLLYPALYTLEAIYITQKIWSISFYNRIIFIFIL